MAEAVYILCALTSLLCAVLLLRAWRRSRLRLLLWSALCFAGLAVNNGVLLLDLVIFPDVDFAVMRGATALVSVAVLLYGLIWEGQ
jgi:hypothetical protein